MVYLFLILSIGLFVILFKVLGLLPRVRQVLATVGEAVAVMRSAELSEEAKEAAIQSSALRVLVSILAIVLRSVVVLAGPLAFVALCSALGLYSLDEAWQAAGNPYFIVGSSAVMIAAMIVLR